MDPNSDREEGAATNGGAEHPAGQVPSFLGRGRRGRLLASLIRIVAEDGSQALTATTIAGDADLTTDTFHEHFESVDDCYLAAFELAAGELTEKLTTAWCGAERWPLQVRAAIAAALDFFAGAPELAALLLTEPFLADFSILRRHQTEVGRLVPFLAQGRGLAGLGNERPGSLELALLGSLSSQIGRKARTVKVDELPGFRDELTQFVLTPYLGHAEARRISRE